MTAKLDAQRKLGTTASGLFRHRVEQHFKGKKVAEITYPPVLSSSIFMWDRRPVQWSRSCQKLERPCFFQTRLHPLVVAVILIETMSHWAHIAHRRRCNIKPFTLSSKPFSTGQDALAVLIPPLGFLFAMTT